MYRGGLVSLVGVVICLLGGCARHHCRDVDCTFAGCAQHQKGPKTLLQWADCEKKEDKANGNGKEPDNGNGGEKRNGGNGGGAPKTGGAEEEEDTLKTDRPDFTEASSTVGRGRIQLEAGYTYFRDRDAGVTTTLHSYPETLLRIGMFAEWFELRLGQNYLNIRARDGRDETRVVGLFDTYLGVKLALTEQKKCLPETALILQTFVPTGADVFTFKELMPGVSFLFSWELLPDFLSLSGSLLANRFKDGADHFHIEVAQSLSLGYQLTKRLSAYTEWFAFYPAGAIDPDARPRHFLDGGFAFLVSNNFQLDVRAGVGLNRRADNFFAGTGFAVRF